MGNNVASDGSARLQDAGTGERFGCESLNQRLRHILVRDERDSESGSFGGFTSCGADRGDFCAKCGFIGRQFRGESGDGIGAAENDPVVEVGLCSGFAQRSRIGRRTDRDERKKDGLGTELTQGPREFFGLMRGARHDDTQSGEALHAPAKAESKPAAPCAKRLCETASAASSALPSACASSRSEPSGASTTASNRTRLSCTWAKAPIGS